MKRPKSIRKPKEPEPKVRTVFQAFQDAKAGVDVLDQQKRYSQNSFHSVLNQRKAAAKLKGSLGVQKTNINDYIKKKSVIRQENLK